MFGINHTHSLATVAVAVTVGAFAAAGSAGAATHPSGLIAYNGHAGLGASVAGVTDGTSNTIMFGARAAAPADGLILMADSGGQFYS